MNIINNENKNNSFFSVIFIKKLILYYIFAYTIKQTINFIFHHFSNSLTRMNISDTPIEDLYYQKCQSYLYNNQNECTAVTTLSNLIHIKDFDHYSDNPFAMVFLVWDNFKTYPHNSSISTFNMIFFSICYAYSLFRLVLDIAVIFYAYKKIHMLSEDSTQKKIKENIGLKYEIIIYQVIIYLGVIFELIMSFHNFIVWRGLQYYTSAQDNFYDINMDRKPPRICNCIYNPLLYNLDFDEKYGYKKSNWLQIVYVLWVFFEFCGMFIIYFSVLTLSRINRKGKSGWNLLKGTILKSIILSLWYGIILFMLIFYFGLPVFYKFYSFEVLTFWFFWKVLGFFVIFERLHSKYWLFQNLKIHSLFSQKKQWKTKLNQIKRDNLVELEKRRKQSFADEDTQDLIKTLKKQNDLNNKEIEAIGDIIKHNKESINVILKNSMEKFFEKTEKIIQKSTNKFENSKLKTNWEEYLNYFLGLNLLGAAGYFFLMIDAMMMSDPKTKYKYFDPLSPEISSYYYVGIFFCYTEIIIFDLTHGIFLMNCFFVELVKFLNRFPRLGDSRLGVIDISQN